MNIGNDPGFAKRDPERDQPPWWEFVERLIAAERCRDVHPARSMTCAACSSWARHVVAKISSSPHVRNED